MLEHFVARHIPVLFIATTTTIGGAMPLYDPVAAIRTFGFPQRIAISKAAHPVMACGSARVSALGIALWWLYFRGHLEAMDIVLAALGWVGLVDGYVCWKEGVPGKAVFRSVSAGLVALWGFLGMTAGR